MCGLKAETIYRLLHYQCIAAECRTKCITLIQHANFDALFSVGTINSIEYTTPRDGIDNSYCNTEHKYTFTSVLFLEV